MTLDGGCAASLARSTPGYRAEFSAHNLKYVGMSGVKQKNHILETQQRLSSHE